MGLFLVLSLMFFGSAYESQKQFDICKEKQFEGQKCIWAKKLNKLGGKK